MNNFSIGGTEKFLYNLIKNFDRDKFQISIASTWGSGPLEKDFQELGLPIYFAGPRGTLSNIFAKIFSVFGTTFRLVIFLKKNKPDIVITSLYQSDILGIFSAWLVGVKKRIFIQHDVKRLNFFVRIIKRIFAVNLATKIIANSNTTKDFLISFFRAPESKISVIYNGVDSENMKRGAKKAAEKNIVFGIIGRLEPVKGHICFLEAMKILKKEGFEPQALLVGDGELREQLKEFTKKNGLENIQFTGMAGDVPAQLKLIDVLVVPSLSEGFGLVALEGLFSEKVVVASALPAIKEFIQHNDNGFLFEPGNAKELALILKALITDYNFLLSAQARIKKWLETTGQRFNIANVALCYEEIFS